MQYISSTSGYNSSPSSTIDSSSTLNIQAGDVLVTYVYGDIQGGLTLTVADTSSGNSHVALGWTTAWLKSNIAYLLSGTSNSTATIRASLSSTTNGAAGLLVLQFRPDSGESVSFGNGPASASSGYGNNPTSAQLSSSGNALWVGGAAISASTSDPEINNVNCDGYAEHNANYYAMLGYRIIATSQSNIAYDVTAGYGTWGAQLLFLSIESSTSSGNNYYYMMNQ